MARKKPKQSSGYQEQKSALAGQIRDDLKRLGMTQRDLAAASGLPETRISRLLRNGHVTVTEQDINQLALGLGKTVQERDEMRYLAWPQLYYIDQALAQSEDVISLNCRLYDAGLPLLGSDYLE